MVKDEHHQLVHQVIQLIQLLVHLKLNHHLVVLILIRLNIRMPVGVLVNHKVHKDHHQLVHHQINIIMELIHLMAHQVHLHIKHQLVMTISRPIRHLHPITVVDERARIYTVQFFFSFLSSLYSSFCFVVLYYHYLYHYIDTIVIACMCVCVFCLLNNLFFVSISSSLVFVGCFFFFSLSLSFTCLYVRQSYYLKKNTFVFLIIIFSSIIISDIFDVAFFFVLYFLVFLFFLLSSNKDLERYLLLLFVAYRFLDDDDDDYIHLIFLKTNTVFLSNIHTQIRTIVLFSFVSCSTYNKVLYLFVYMIAFSFHSRLTSFFFDVIIVVVVVLVVDLDFSRFLAHAYICFCFLYFNYLKN